MCTPSLTGTTPQATVTTSKATHGLAKEAAAPAQNLKNKTGKIKSVSFEDDIDTVILIDRLELAFYTAADFRRFREELQEHENAETAQRKALLEKRQQGYNKLLARCAQRVSNSTNTATKNINSNGCACGALGTIAISRSQSLTGQ